MFTKTWRDHGSPIAFRVRVQLEACSLLNKYLVTGYMFPCTVDLVKPELGRGRGEGEGGGGGGGGRGGGGGGPHFNTIFSHIAVSFTMHPPHDTEHNQVTCV